MLIVGADSLMTGLTPDLALRSLSESRDQQYEMPFGIPVANTFAMTAQRHMNEFGTTAEQLAEVAVIQREHAARTPARRDERRSRSRMCSTRAWVTTPYHKLDCSLISEAAPRSSLTSAERAKALGVAKPIYILAAASATRTSTSS